MERRLAAILAADVVGFSRMMGADEAAALSALGELRHDVFEPLVAAHRGTVVKRMGDGWLVAFDSALDAVTCALAVQEQLTGDRETRSEIAPMQLRIGIHVGDVVHDDEHDIHGDGVNVAARLETVSPTGGIAVSDQVYNSLDGTRRAAFGDGGEQILKNIVRPVRVWNWPAGSRAASVGAMSAAGSVPAILLETLSLGGDTDDAADLALDILSGLQDAMSSRSGIRVVTVDDADSAPTYRLQGRCRVSGARCRLHLSITVTASGETCWTTKIDGHTDDPFAFVDDVVWRVGAAIRVHVNAHAGAALATRSNDGLSVQELLSKAAYFMHLSDSRSMQSARDAVGAALAKDPESAMALAMQSYALMYAVPLAAERAEDIDVRAILTIADRAVHLGPGIDYTFHNRARIRLWLRGDHRGCREDARRALAINADFHFAIEDLALADIFGAEPARGVTSMEDIIRQLPTHTSTPYRLSILAIGHVVLGDMASALSYARDAYERRPMVRLHALAYAAAAAGDATLTGTDEFRAMVAEHELCQADAARFPFARDADRAALAALLRRSGLPE